LGIIILWRCKIPFYDYQCCECYHVQEVRHGMTENPVVICERCKYTCRKLLSPNFLISGQRDIADYNDIRKTPPRYLRFKDGHRERFDPTKHGMRKGSESYSSSAKAQPTKTTTKRKKGVK
jgi:putative FmdB family regulatory protein